jgi:hypothetical protein
LIVNFISDRNDWFKIATLTNPKSQWYRMSAQREDKRRVKS